MNEAVSILPDNSTAFERVLASTDDRILEIDADLVRRVTRPDECPPDQLHILAWEYSVDEWEPLWSVAQKRAAINVSFDIHRFKGTAFAMGKAIATLGHGAIIEEWFEYGGHPYRFRLSIELEPTQVFAKSEIEQIVRVALRTKNVRSYLDYIGFRRTTEVPVYIAAALRSKITHTIAPFLLSLIETRPYAFVAAGLSSKSIVTIYPGD